VKPAVKKDIKTPGTLSIKDITTKEEDKKNGVDEAESIKEGGPANPFTQQQLEEAWKEYMAKINGRYPSFSSALGKYLPQLKENYLIEITTDNVIIAKSSEQLHNLIKYLKDTLQNYSIHYKMVITKNDNTKTPYTDKEKYEAMIIRNPSLKTLKDKLDLEVEF